MIPFALWSPVTGDRLRADTTHSLAGTSGERWPVVDAIAYLRTGKEALVDDVLDLLDSGHEEEALVLLLADRDGGAPDQEGDLDAIRALVRDRAGASLTQALDALATPEMAEYFRYRWSDPAYLAGLALLEAHWNAPRCAFDVACGIGHYLRELQIRGFKVAGGDLSFAHLWIARHWLLEGPAQLVCFDAAAGWPIKDAPVDLVMCHDAFDLFGPKADIVACLRTTAGEDGWLAVSQIRNRARFGGGIGEPLGAADVEEMFPDGLIYADRELTRALVEARAPVPVATDRLSGLDAFSVVFGPGMRPAPRAVLDGLALPAVGTPLTRNPLYQPAGDGGYEIRWPSERYRAEHGTDATFPPHTRVPDQVLAGPDVQEPARRRELLALPPRW